MEWKWNENCSYSAGNLFPGIFARNATERDKNIFKPMGRWHIGTHTEYERAAHACVCELALFTKYNLIASSVKSIYQKYLLLLIPLELFFFINSWCCRWQANFDALIKFTFPKFTRTRKKRSLHEIATIYPHENLVRLSEKLQHRRQTVQDCFPSCGYRNWAARIVYRLMWAFLSDKCLASLSCNRHHKSKWGEQMYALQNIAVHSRKARGRHWSFVVCTFGKWTARMLFIISFDFDGLRTDKDGIQSRINNKVCTIYICARALPNSFANACWWRSNADDQKNGKSRISRTN